MKRTECRHLKNMLCGAREQFRKINHLAFIFRLVKRRASEDVKRALCSNNLIKVHVGALRLATGPRNANVNYKSQRCNDNEERGSERETDRHGANVLEGVRELAGRKKKAKVRGNSSKWEPLILLIRLAATRRVITNVKRYEKSWDTCPPMPALPHPRRPTRHKPHPSSG